MFSSFVPKLLAFIFTFHYGIFFAQAQDSIGPCTCDLTRFSCDVNCCCDPDCTASDRQTFTSCTVTYAYENPRSCSQSAVLYRNFTPYTSNTTSSDLFCVYFDRYSDRNYYVTPTVDATSASSVSDALASYATDYKFADVTSGLDPASLRNDYRTNVPVQVMFSTRNLTGFLAHPRPGNSPDCNYASPALFLDSSASTCYRQVTNASCTTDSAISLTSFVENFRVASQPSVLNSGPDYNTSSSLVSVVQTSVLCLDAAGVSTNCTDVPAPNLSGTDCVNVLSRLTYTVKYVSGTGITEITYDAVLRTIPVSQSVSLQQTFGFSYSLSSSSAAGYPRSGNPGYLGGQPLIASVANTTTRPTVMPDPSSLTLPAVNPDGSCADTAGQAVLFGERVRAACSRTLTWDSGTKSISAGACASLNSAVLASLVGLGINGTTYLATFGNSSVNNTGDWFPVRVQDSCRRTLSQSSTACTQTILGATLEVLVAKAGSLSNPQSKLVGARLSCEAGTIIFQCAAGSCGSNGTTMKLLTTYTVTFTDVSSTPQVGAKQRPVYLLSLPTDFFYPLYTASPAARPAPPAAPLLWLLCLAALCGGWRATAAAAGFTIVSPIII